MKITSQRIKYRSMYPWVFIAYGPGIVMRDEAKWCNWHRYNGIAFRICDHVTWIEIR